MFKRIPISIHMVVYYRLNNLQLLIGNCIIPLKLNLLIITIHQSVVPPALCTTRLDDRYQTIAPPELFIGSPGGTTVW